MPRKMSGSEISTIDWLMKTISVPMVTVTSATQRYDERSGSAAEPLAPLPSEIVRAEEGRAIPQKVNVNVRVMNASGLRPAEQGPASGGGPGGAGEVGRRRDQSGAAGGWAPRAQPRRRR